MGESFGGGFVKATLTTQLKVRRDTFENLNNMTTPLAEGEPAYATDTKKFAIGDGVHSFGELIENFMVLPFYSNGPGYLKVKEICDTMRAYNVTHCMLRITGYITFSGYIYSRWVGGDWYCISLIDFQNISAVLQEYYQTDTLNMETLIGYLSPLVFSSDLEGYVTLDTEQEISGKKSFVRSILRSNTNPEEGGYVDVGSSAKPFDRMFATYSHIPWAQTNFSPATNNTYSLGLNENGTKERYWKNLYLHENIISKHDPDDPTSYFTLPVREIVDFHSEQTLTGIKIFEAPILIGQNQILMDSSNRINLCYNDKARVKIGNAETLFVSHVSPDSADKYNLGRAGLYWKDLYLSDNIITKNKTIIVDEIPTMQDLVRVYDLRSIQDEE